MGSWGVDAYGAEPSLQELRLSVVSSDPVLGGSGAGFVYLVPYVGNRISLRQGGRWRRFAVGTVVSAAVPATTETPFDVFAYPSGNSVALETESWSTAGTRGVSLTRVHGVLHRSGANPDRRYLGTACTTDVSGETEDTETRRLLWNLGNQLPRLLRLRVQTQWSGAGSWQAWDGDTDNIIETVRGLASGIAGELTAVASAEDSVAGATPQIAIAEDGFTPSSSIQHVSPPVYEVPADQTVVHAVRRIFTTSGRRFFAPLDLSNATTTWNRSGASHGDAKLYGWWLC